MLQDGSDHQRPKDLDESVHLRAHDLGSANESRSQQSTDPTPMSYSGDCYLDLPIRSTYGTLWSVVCLVCPADASICIDYLPMDDPPHCTGKKEREKWLRSTALPDTGSSRNILVGDDGKFLCLHGLARDSPHIVARRSQRAFTVTLAWR